MTSSAAAFARMGRTLAKRAADVGGPEDLDAVLKLLNSASSGKAPATDADKLIAELSAKIDAEPKAPAADLARAAEAKSKAVPGGGAAPKPRRAAAAAAKQQSAAARAAPALAEPTSALQKRLAAIVAEARGKAFPAPRRLSAPAIGLNDALTAAASRAAAAVRRAKIQARAAMAASRPRLTDTVFGELHKNLAPTALKSLRAPAAPKKLPRGRLSWILPALGLGGAATAGAAVAAPPLLNAAAAPTKGPAPKGFDDRWILGGALGLGALGIGGYLLNDHMKNKAKGVEAVDESEEV